MHHTKQGSRERLKPHVWEDGVCLYQTNTFDGAGWWGLLWPVWAPTGSTDDTDWVNVFLRVEQAGPHILFHICWCQNDASLLLNMPEWRWMCVIYQWPRCEASKSQCRLSAHVDTLLETEGRGQMVLASSGYINTGQKLEYKIVQRVLDFCQNWVKYRTLFFIIRTGAEISNE